ncbi:hypothetical protein CHELA1G11_20847 [Hyphomicrobiales bacterium]|nr:hypothetical protein CHELA1G11_20847 [Hyphomicrobiales bacterium]CAH1692241.1 hypothetical protein CHELA1G2_21164 [Hyphomicrobiales bacterium]
MKLGIYTERPARTQSGAILAFLRPFLSLPRRYPDHVSLTRHAKTMGTANEDAIDLSSA